MSNDFSLCRVGDSDPTFGFTVFFQACVLRSDPGQHFGTNIFVFPLSTLHPHLVHHGTVGPLSCGLTSVNCKYTWGRPLREGKPDWLSKLNVFLCNSEWPFQP